MRHPWPSKDFFQLYSGDGFLREFLVARRLGNAGRIPKRAARLALSGSIGPPEEPPRLLARSPGVAAGQGARKQDAPYPMAGLAGLSLSASAAAPGKSTISAGMRDAKSTFARSLKSA